MAKRMVTRTVVVSMVDVMCLTVSTATVGTTTFMLTGEYTADDALKEIKRQYETDDFKPTVVTAINKSEKLYGMLETDFVKYAEILPPRATND